MDQKIGILHLSDFHICSDNSAQINKLLNLLYDDVNKMCSEYNIFIKLICITGDLINKGDNSDTELELALDTIIFPLLTNFKLESNNVFIVPGNHEIKKQLINEYTEDGLSTKLISTEEVKKFYNNLGTEFISRISYFNVFQSMFSGPTVFRNDLCSCYSFEIEGKRFGIACVNSAWRSSGKGPVEKPKMIIGKNQITDCLDSLNDSDIKICLMHHPLDWLMDFDKFDIERCINNFDIVLNGHIHSSDSKTYHSFNGQTLFNTCGKFDLSSDIFNGYSLLAINPYNLECDVYLRQYQNHPRDCFDRAIHLSKNGTYSAKLDAKDETKVLAYEIVHGIRKGFLEYANSFFVSNVAEGYTAKTFEDVFVYPSLSRFSEYEKETMLEEEDYNEQEQDIKLKDNTEVQLEVLCSNTDNIFIYGKKEIGKTTLLHFFAKYYLSNFNSLGKVPVIINCLTTDFSGLKSIEKATQLFIHEYSCESFKISITQIQDLFSKGIFVVMFDNFETITDKKLPKINDFILKYSNNRFIFSNTESINSSLTKYNSSESLLFKHTKLYMRSMSKNQIRTMTTNLIGSISLENGTSLVDKMMICFKNTNLPKIPFIVSLILSICKENTEFVPVNEAVVMENFMEILLEKQKPDEFKSSTYDFRNKENFLIYLVSFMNENDRFYLSVQEFERLVFEYHNQKGFEISETKFDKLFFSKGVLVKKADIITFRYSCMVEYYLAKKAMKDPDFLKFILSDENYLNYQTELSFYTGLNRDDTTVLNAIEPNFLNLIDDYLPLMSELDDYNIGLDFSMSKDKFEELSEKRLTIEESDRLTDIGDSSESKLPERITKQKKENKNTSKFVKTLHLYGVILKNSEHLDVEIKSKMLNNYISGLCILLAIFKNMAEEHSIRMIEEIERGAEDDKEIKVKKIIMLAEDIIKISLPLIVENFALENMGSIKIKSFLLDYINKQSNDSSFEKFISLFLYIDLRTAGFIPILKDFVKKIETKDLLKITFFKIMYYYHTRYFPKSLDNDLENLLAEINLKMNKNNSDKKKKIDKSKVIRNIRNLDREIIDDKWSETY